MSPVSTESEEPAEYTMRLSRLTVDKLGVKLYDRVSAVVAELIANGYDADAEMVAVSLPLGTELATKNSDGTVTDKGYIVTVEDDGHGMTPSEAQNYFLVVGADRRKRPYDTGTNSRTKKRPVMGRKGIGKLAPFGICRRIEVRSAGGDKTKDGYRVSHFILDFDKIVQDSDKAVPIESGPDDKTWDNVTGTKIVLSQFLSKRVPAEKIFLRQVSRRFALTSDDFEISIDDTRSGNSFEVPKFDIEVNEDTRVDVSSRPVPFGDDEWLGVSGWLAFGKRAYKDEEEAGVRIYARGKIVATTRDFEQPAGFTGEFAARSYLVGEVHAEWLDSDNDEDLIRTDRQGILWDSEHGAALRNWGAALIKEIAKNSAGPRRKKKAEDFVKKSELERKAKERYGAASESKSVVDAVLDLGEKIGAFASEDEMGDQDYVDDLADIILSVAPHRALIDSFKKISKQEDKSIDDLLNLFSQTRTAEMASYAQIAAERVLSIDQLRETIDQEGVQEADLQNLISKAPWLIRPDWSVISENQGLKTFRERFTKFWKEERGTDIDIAISYEQKRPDFTAVHLGRQLHIVELKKPKHAFADADYERLENYLDAFEEFFAKHKAIADDFPEGWVVDLIVDDVAIKGRTERRAYESAVQNGQIIQSTWYDFIAHAAQAHSKFLEARDKYAKDGI
jgi:hypothetical protein